MKIDFNSTPADANEPIVLEQVFAEKPGGGIVADPQVNLPAGTAVGLDAAKKIFVAIKGARLQKANTEDDTTLTVAPKSGIKVGEFLGFGEKAVKVTKVVEAAESDTITVTMGVAIPAGAVLYQAKAAAESGAEPLHKPAFITGAKLVGGKGDQMVRLVNGANVRKETANFGEDIANVLTSIHLI